MRFIAALAACGLTVSALTTAPLQAAAPPQLTQEHRAALRCSAAFAIVASEQSGGDALQGWPPLASRGKVFFADTGERVMAEAALSREAVRDLISGEVRALQTAKDPDAALAALARPCVALLDAAVAPLIVPDLKQCAAILGLAYDEVHTREGLSPAAQDLRTLASVLSAREREAVIATGRSGDEADRTLAQAREAMATEASDAKGGVGKYDISHCYDLAKPDEKTHY